MRFVRARRTAAFFLNLFFMIATGPTLDGAKQPGQGECERPEWVEEEPEEMLYHFHLAETSYRENDVRTSANEIRRAADSMSRRLAFCGEQLRALLRASVLEMKQLADDVEKGQVSSVERIQEVFARAEVALARHHLERANRALEQGNYSQTGQALSSSIKSLQSAVVRAGYKDDGTITRAAERGRAVSEKLLEDPVIEPADVGEALSDLEVAIAEFEASKKISE
jgi:hypothetical protein